MKSPAREKCGEIMPRKAAKQKANGPQWYDDDDLWLDLVRELDDNQVESVARLLHKLINEIEKPDGAFHVRCCLENGRRVLFPFTKFADECKTMFIERLDGPGPHTVAAVIGRKRTR
jgi:hypothetical protein